jgi:hypothetical protein
MYIVLQARYIVSSRQGRLLASAVWERPSVLCRGAATRHQLCAINTTPEPHILCTLWTSTSVLLFLSSCGVFGPASLVRDSPSSLTVKAEMVASLASVRITLPVTKSRLVKCHALGLSNWMRTAIGTRQKTVRGRDECHQGLDEDMRSLSHIGMVRIR